MDLPHQELTGKVIAAAIAVHQEMRPGLDEKLYERALCIELADRGIYFEQQPKYEATYKGHFLGHLIPDLVVERTLIVDAKCVDAFAPVHDARMIGYLNITGLDIALLLNFKNLAAWQTENSPARLPDQLSSIASVISVSSVSPW